MKYTQNGAYNLKRVELYFDDGESINLIPLMLDATIYESMFDVGISGNVSIMDSTSLYTEKFLGNGERIKIEFETAGTETAIAIECVVYKTSPPTRTTENSSGILLYFVSEEIINDKRNFVKRSFNDTVTGIVKKVHKQISQKPLALSPSKELHHLVGAHQRPLSFIGALSGRAISTENEYGYLYYENNKQFCFLPIESLYKQAPISEYFYNNKGIFDDVNKKEEEAFNSIQDYEIVEVPDMFLQMGDGVYGSETVNLNLITKSTTKSTYDNQSNYSQNKSLAKVPNMNKELINSANSDFRGLFISDKDAPFHNFRHNNLRVIMNGQKYAANVSVFGDTNLVCGAVIKAQLPVWGTNARKNNAAPDPFSGKFLVAEIKHTLKKKQYMQTLKLVKDSFEVGK